MATLVEFPDKCSVSVIPSLAKVSALRDTANQSAMLFGASKSYALHSSRSPSCGFTPTPIDCVYIYFGIEDFYSTWTIRLPISVS